MTLRWLHLSDLHFRTGDWGQRASLGPLPKQLPELIGEPVDLVFISGDIAFSGKLDEYKIAADWLSELLERLHVDPRQRLFVVPGNHDVDRSRVSSLTSLAKQQLLSITDPDAQRERLGAILGNTDELAHLTMPMDAFFGFQQQLCGSDHSCSIREPSRTIAADVGGVNCAISMLCSSIFSDANDRHGQLFLGERVVRSAIASCGARCEVHFVLFHHPFAWIHDAESSRCRRLLANQSCATIALSGHLHDQESVSMIAGSSSMLNISAGSCYPGSRWKHGFLVGEYRPENRLASLTHYTFSLDRWHLDEGASADGNTTVHRFSVPTIDAPPLAVDRASTLQALTTASQRVHRTAKLIGFPVRLAGQEPKLADIFVEPEIRAIDRTSINSAEDLRQAVTSLGSLRLAVTGQAGLGKSTLLSHLAMCSSPTRPVVLLRATDLEAELSENTFSSAICKAIRSSLDISILAAFLDESIARSEIVLLIDAVDEVVDRVRFVERFSDWLEGRPSASVLVSARSFDFENMSMLRETFPAVEIQPMSDATLDRFLRAWSTAIGGVSEKERGGRVADLIDALKMDRAIKSMMRNPLLATLITMVHWSVGGLPSYRAKAYEMCVELLLETWPSRAGRAFAAIPMARQKSLLFDLARDLVDGRRASHVNSSINIDDAIASVARQLEERDGSSDCRQLASDWLWHLANNTGLIEPIGENRTFQFSHLTFLEFLAARGIYLAERGKGDEHIASMLASHAIGTASEVWLLMLGSESEDGRLLHKCVEKLLDAFRTSKSPVSHLSFLFSILRDNIPVSRAHVTEILSIAVGKAHRRELWPRYMESELWSVLRFSEAYREIVVDLAAEGFASAPVDELEKHFLLFGRVLVDSVKREWLETRKDWPQVAGRMIDLFPLGGVGFLLEGRSPEELSEWALARPIGSEFSCFLKLMKLDERPGPCMACVPLILERCAEMPASVEGKISGVFSEARAAVPRELRFVTTRGSRVDRVAVSEELNGGFDVYFDLRGRIDEIGDEIGELGRKRLDQFAGNPSLVSQLIVGVKSMVAHDKQELSVASIYRGTIRYFWALTLTDERGDERDVSVEMGAGPSEPVRVADRWRTTTGLESFIRYAMDCAYGLSEGGESAGSIRGENRWFVEVADLFRGFVAELNDVGVDAGFLAMSISAFQTTHEWAAGSELMFEAIRQDREADHVLVMLLDIYRWLRGEIDREKLLLRLSDLARCSGPTGDCVYDWAVRTTMTESGCTEPN